MVTLSKVAKSVVHDSLRPKPDEVVLISAFPHSIELAEDIGLECQKAGADPAIFLDTDALHYEQFKNYPIEAIRKTSAHCLGLLDYVNSYVWLVGPKDPSRMATVPDEKYAALFEGEKAHGDKALEKKPKNVAVGLGQVTRERAKAYGFNFAKWKAMVEAATTVNYERMASLGTLIAGLLANPVTVRLRADNGTDVKVRLAGPARPAIVDDGRISDEDLARGTAADRSVFLPAGEVAVAPVEDSAEGTFVADVPMPQRGRLIEGLSWTFRKGHVTDFTAKRNLRFAQTNWAGASGQKDMFGGLGFGLNAKALPGFLTNQIVSGSVSVRIGENRDIGGANDSSYIFIGTVAHGDVEIGGKKVIEDGAWII